MMSNNKEMIVGIDPGIAGGVAVIDMKGNMIDGMRTPVMLVKKKKLVDAHVLFDWLTEYNIHTAVVEQVSGRPGQAGLFQFGRTTGQAEAVCMILADRISWTPPATWKKYFGLSPDKQASLDLAHQKFGKAFHWTYKADDGIAEAALIALHHIRNKV
jgi:crossover junction endodeoxyribonuclease RuvC